MKANVIFRSTLLVFLIQESQGKEGDHKECFPSCPEGWELEEDSCYLWTDIRKTWDQAERYCNNEDGHLAFVTSRNIHNYILSKAKSRDKKQEGYWIGGRYLEQEDRWRWTDGSIWEFSRWGTGQPNNADAGNQHCLLNCLQRICSGWMERCAL